RKDHGPADDHDRRLDEGALVDQITAEHRRIEPVRLDVAHEPMVLHGVPDVAVAPDQGFREARHGASAGRAAAMKAVTRAGSTGFHHTPPSLSELATITP